MNWEIVGIASGAAAAGVAISQAISRGLAGFVALKLRAELATFKIDFTKELNGTYTRAGECGLKHKQITDSLSELKSAVHEIDAYTHERMHEIAGQADIKLKKREWKRTFGTDYPETETRP